MTSLTHLGMGREFRNQYGNARQNRICPERRNESREGAGGGSVQGELLMCAERSPMITNRFSDELVKLVPTPEPVNLMWKVYL
jgi:hypothetical protein